MPMSVLSTIQLALCKQCFWALKTKHIPDRIQNKNYNKLE